MLAEVSKEAYRKHFTVDSSLFISEPFIELVEKKCDRVVRLMKDNDASVGLIAGIMDDVAKSPFSAPFGGFHYTHENMSYQTVFDFVSDLKEYVAGEKIKQLRVTLPPDLFQSCMNAKFVNAMIRLGFTMQPPDLVNWVSLRDFNGKWVKNVVDQNCRKAVKHGLTFSVVTERELMEEAYEVIRLNREEKGRKIYMTLNDLMDVSRIIPVDFFLVRDRQGVAVGAGVFYRGDERIVHGVFVGVRLEKRNLGTMNFLYKNCYEHYKEMGFDYINLGISSLNGEPNTGLIRFKELHNCVTSLQYTLSLTP